MPQPSKAVTSTQGRSATGKVPGAGLHSISTTGKRYGMAPSKVALTMQSRSLGYAHWPEQAGPFAGGNGQSRSLGYAHWPEHTPAEVLQADESRSLGYAHWPEHDFPDSSASC